MSENKAIDKANLELALSENNKKLLEYTDNADTKLRQEFGPVSKYQRYLNTELDYIQVRFSEDTIVNNVAVDTIVPFDTIIISKNIEFNTSTYVFKLKAGKTYRIVSRIRTLNSSGYFYFVIYNKTQSKNIRPSGCVETPASYNNNAVNIPAEAIINCNEDTEIQIKIAAIDKTRAITFTGLCSVVIEEINRQIVIDPIEHVNTEYGLEDAPVGHIISHMGTKAPSHYLICDGSEYDILLYPELANHILDNFGSYNYFGGDGVNTFAVPDLRERFLKGSENPGVNEEAGLPNITANWKSEPSGSASGAVTHAYESGTMQAVTSGGKQDSRLYFDASLASSVYGNSDTVTPANTSVLYCIKYEHTYYTKVNNTNYLSASLYSEEERVIGCWINGKPLYEKTILTTTPSKILTDENVADVSDLNIDALINIEGFNIATGDKGSYTNDNNARFFHTWFRNFSNTIAMRIIENTSCCNIPVYIVIKYTKTTDAENSFTEDMIKDYISSSNSEDISYTDAEIQAIIKEGVAEINEEA